MIKFLLIAVASIFVFSSFVKAAPDFEAPVVKSLTVSGTPKVGQDLVLIIEATDNSSGVAPRIGDLGHARGFEGWIKSVKYNIDDSERAYKVEQISETQFALSFKIRDNMSPGEYYLAGLTVTDKANNEYKTYGDVNGEYSNGLPVLKFLVFNK
jgi:hypothetical protein